MGADEVDEESSTVPTVPVLRQSAPSAASKATRRLKDAGEAAGELYEGFNDWSSSLASYGRQAAYALIAANWAVYGSTSAILVNDWAKASLVIVIAFLGLNLILTGWMTRLYKERSKYADRDKARWEGEFNQAAGVVSPWPYTPSLQFLGAFIRILNIWAPVLSGSVFIAGLFV